MHVHNLGLAINYQLVYCNGKYVKDYTLLCKQTVLENTVWPKIKTDL